MTKGKKISDLIAPKKPEWGGKWTETMKANLAKGQGVTINNYGLRNIKNLEKLTVIFQSYIDREINWLVKGIEEYDTDYFTFFKDLGIYLQYGYRKEKYRIQAYNDIVEIYLNQYTPNAEEIKEII
jgi:hypothetical protein